MIDYTLVRQKRRTMAIVLRPDGTVEVRVPTRVSREAADRFVDSKGAWIAAHERKRQALLPFSQPTDRLLPLFGVDCEVTPGGGTTAQFDGTRFCIPAGSDDERRRAVDKLYRKLAREQFAPMLEALSRELALPYGGLRVGGAKARWGSCNGDGRIALTWRLLALPRETIRYVMIHELCHTKHRNHGRAFYDMLYALCPDHRDRDDDLRRWAVRLGACYTLLGQ